MNKIESLLLVILTLLFLFGCSKKEAYITVRAIDEATNLPLPHSEIIVGQVTKPIFSMQGNKKIFEGNTNIMGEFSFRVDNSKTYTIDIFEKDREQKDVNAFYAGGKVIEGNEINNHDTLDIVIKRIKRRNLLSPQ